MPQHQRAGRQASRGRLVHERSRVQLGMSAASNSATEDATLTTRCLLQYCAVWPHHRSWVRDVLAKDGFNLEYLVDTPFTADKELVLGAVRSCGASLQFAAPELRSDRQVVLTAVTSDPFALGFAGSELRGDADVVLRAMRGDPAALAMADARLFCSQEFMLAAIKLDATAATYAAPQLLADPLFRASAKQANSMVVHWFVNTEHFGGLQDPEVQQEFQAAQDAVD